MCVLAAASSTNSSTAACYGLLTLQLRALHMQCGMSWQSNQAQTQAQP
jgi:hypothetical protein